MSTHRPSVADKRRAFREMHRSGCFVIPNPWDPGSALFLQSAGFRALATTSSGHAWSQARRDGGVPRERVLAHLRDMVAATDVPINADFENGFAADAPGVAESVRLAVETGVAGLSIEDSTGNAAAPLFELDRAAERIRAARRAIDVSGTGTVLVARAECFLVGQPDIGTTVQRLKAYAEAGADCLYAPGIRGAQEIRTVIEAVQPKPVNVLVSSPGGPSLRELEAMGVRRVSLGGALARVAWSAFMRAARSIAEHGDFEALAGAASHADLEALFRER